MQQQNPYASERVDASGGSSSKLPQERSSSYKDSYTINKASSGYLTLQQLAEIFEHQRASPEEWPASKVASSYNIELNDAENLLKYFTSYRVVATFKDPRPEMKFHNLHE